MLSVNILWLNLQGSPSSGLQAANHHAASANQNTTNSISCEKAKSGCHVGRPTGINNRAKDWQMSSLRMSKQVTFSAVKKYRLQWNKQTIFIWMLESLKTVCVPPCITAHVSQIESLWEWKCWRQGFELGTTYSILGEKVVCATISLYKFMHVMKHTNAPD